jgi:hypothetical protein
MKIKIPQIVWYDVIEMVLNFLSGGEKWGAKWKTRMS